MFSEGGFENPAVIVDTNHSNSAKRYDQQPRIAKEIMHSAMQSSDIRSLVKGLMIESYIEDGSQSSDGGVYGQSITDPCLGWKKPKNSFLNLQN